jgi:hypothetical protein
LRECESILFETYSFTVILASQLLSGSQRMRPSLYSIKSSVYKQETGFPVVSRLRGFALLNLENPTGETLLKVMQNRHLLS